MAKIDVFNLKREKVGTVDLADEVFAAEVKEHLFYEVVKAQLASRASGTASAKERSAVSGARKKLYKQKGTGGARHGSIRAPIYVGGGRAHPPRPRTGATVRRARCASARSSSALSQVRQGRPPRSSSTASSSPRSRRRSLLAALVDARRRTRRRSIVDDRVDNENLRLSIRNCADHQFLPPEGVNVYDLLRHDTLVVSQGRGEGPRGPLPSHEGDRANDGPKRSSVARSSSPRRRTVSASRNQVVFEVAPRREQDPDQGRRPEPLQRQGRPTSTPWSCAARTSAWVVATPSCRTGRRPSSPSQEGDNIDFFAATPGAG